MARSVIKHETFVALDLETTGLTPVVNRIIEIGAVRFRAGKVLDTCAIPKGLFPYAGGYTVWDI